jgi:hypothetical protein
MSVNDSIKRTKEILERRKAEEEKLDKVMDKFYKNFPASRIEQDDESEDEEDEEE